MSCGGEGLLAAGGCGCGPGINAHESYKGNWSSGSRSLNYSMGSRYVGQDAPLPETAMTRSYAAEKVYVGRGALRELERIYAPAEREQPRTLSPGTIFASVPAESDNATKLQGTGRLGTGERAYAPQYDKKAAFAELSQLAEVYDKQRLLEQKISEAFEHKGIERMVNTWTN